MLQNISQLLETVTKFCQLILSISQVFFSSVNILFNTYLRVIFRLKNLTSQYCLEFGFLDIFFCKLPVEYRKEDSNSWSDKR